MNCLNKTDIKIFTIILSFITNYKEAYPSLKILGERAGVSERQVKRVLAKLKKLGVLKVKRSNLDKACHRNNSYEINQNWKCPLECPLECPLLIINNNKSYYSYYSNKNNNLYNNLPATSVEVADKKQKNFILEDKPMILKKHLEILLNKDLEHAKSEYVFRFFFLVCREHGYQIPNGLMKKDIGIIKKMQKLMNDKELKDFIFYVVKNWHNLIYKYKIASTVPNLRIINIKLDELYNDFKSSYSENKVSKYIKE